MSAALLLVAIVSLLSLAVAGQAPPAQTSGSFEGDWSGTGTRQLLASGPASTAVITYFSGSLLLRIEGGLGRGYRCEVLTYDNGKGICVGTCVWTDDKGDRIFSDLTGQAVATGRHIHGAITGGTGRYTGITGEYELDWQYVVAGPEDQIQGRAVSLKGSWRKGPPPAAPAKGETP